MTPQAGPPIARDPVNDYRRLASALASRAARLGSRDPESAAQEALRRSLENSKSQPAVAYYFGEESSAAPAPEWPLDQLLAWLHGVLCYVVREEQNRASTRRELPSSAAGSDGSDDRSNVADPAPSQLEQMILTETQQIVADGFSTLDHEYR